MPVINSSFGHYGTVSTMHVMVPAVIAFAICIAVFWWKVGRYL